VTVKQIQRPAEEQREPLPVQTILAIEDAVQGIRFGTVQLVIQDGRIIQIDKTEKIRLS
jgi:hypothetical protein